MKAKTTLSATEENILFFAMRYALNRTSAAPSIVMGVIEEKWSQIQVHTQAQMKREINVAIARGEAGGQYGEDTWKRIHRLETGA